MKLDGHVHIDSLRNNGLNVNSKELMNSMRAADIDGAVLLSQKPTQKGNDGKVFTAKERLNNLMKWTKNEEMLFPFYFINPTDEDASEQVNSALAAGVDGFKIICSTHYPSDVRAMPIYQTIADANKPILFHSGILWDGNKSAKYNRPAEFECLLDIEGLRFTLAHVSWPWVDECIALIGKFLNTYAQRPGFSVEMFIDVTPGTPLIYREDVIKKLMLVEYELKNNIIFGTDCRAHQYNTKWTKKWIECDTQIYEKYGITKEIQKNIFSNNLLRFLGKINNKVEKTIPFSGE